MDSDRGGVGGPRSRRGAKRDVKFVEVGSGGRYQYARRVGTRFDSDASQGARARSVEMVGPSRSVEPARVDMRRARVRAVGYAPRRRPRKPCCISDAPLRPSLLFWRQRRFRLDKKYEKYLRKVPVGKARRPRLSPGGTRVRSFIATSPARKPCTATTRRALTRERSTVKSHDVY